MDVVEKSLSELSAKYRTGEVTGVALVEAYLTRITRYSQPPRNLHAVIAVNPQARAEAAALDAEFSRTGVRGPLHGMPILIKDNIDVAGLPNTAGALALVDNIPTTDAPLIAQLRAAGAVILGKTNLSEFAHFKSNTEPSGFSVVGGQTISALFPDVNPSGSSSGSGVAASFSLAAATIGTETNGSILSPAQHNSVVGLKPTVGLVPQTGIIPIAASQDTAGPMTRTVLDAAMVLDGLVSGGQYAKQVLAEQPLRIGVLAADGEDVLSHRVIAEAQTIFEKAGLVVKPVTFTAVVGAESAELTVLEAEFKAGLNTYLASAKTKMKSLDEVVAFNNFDLATRAPFGQTLLTESLLAPNLTDKAYTDAKQLLATYSKTEGLDVLLADVDVLLAPGAVAIDLAAIAGYPSLAVPAGVFGPIYDAVPSSVVLVAKPKQEAQLLRAGYVYEQATNARLVPAE
jgi:amidase